MSKLVILQTVIPHYRIKFFQYILTSSHNKVGIFGGDCHFEKSLKTDNTITFVNNVKNHFFLHRKLLFQTGMFKKCIHVPVLVLEMNPRIISNWMLLILRKLTNKKTVLWGHAWPRKGKGSKTDFVRNLMRKLASSIIVYTNTQARELQTIMPKKKIVAAPNALYLSSEMKVAKNSKNKINNIIYVGRLTKDKKPMLLLKAFKGIINKLPKSVNLLIVGDGEEKESIINAIKNLKLSTRVFLKGHIGDIDKLSDLYSTSLFSVSPGYIGLSVTQSFGFGVPILVSKNENHSPEIEAVKIGENAVFFKTNCEENLGGKMLEFFGQKNGWVSKRTQISTYCRTTYSVETMAANFIALL